MAAFRGWDVIAGMRALLFLVPLACVQLWSAIAPETLAGKVYHDHAQLILARGSWGWDSIVEFGADGRYRYIKVAAGETATVRSLYPLPSDGAYTYIRTGDSTATLTLNDPQGSLWNPSSLGAQTDSIRYNLFFFSPDVGYCTGPSAGTTALVRFFLTDQKESATIPATNVSMRGRVAAGQPLIFGFIIPAGVVDLVGRDLLIRAVGPSLAGFGVTNTWPDPAFSVRSSSGTLYRGAYYGDMPAIPAPELASIVLKVGAFPLAAGTKDATAVVRLAPGAYTILCEPSAGNVGGEMLLEIYFLP